MNPNLMVVFPNKNLPKIKDVAYIINLHEFKSRGIIG